MTIILLKKRKHLFAYKFQQSKIKLKLAHSHGKFSDKFP